MDDSDAGCVKAGSVPCARTRAPDVRPLDLAGRRCPLQLPLPKGDAVFFKPALFHAAGHNRSPDIRRMANLPQVSSPYGCAMSAALYPALHKAPWTTRELIILEARDFLQAIAGGKPVWSTFRDGDEVDRLIDAALRSMQERSAIALS